MLTYIEKQQSGLVTRNIRESSNQFIIRTKDNWDPILFINSVAQSLGMGEALLIDHFPEASVYLYKLPSDSKKLLGDLKQKVNDAQHPNVVFIGTLFQNEYGQYQIYTGNLFIKLEGLTNAQEENFLAQHQLQIKRRLGFSDSCYFVEPKESIGRRVFDLSRELTSTEGVVMCTPEIVVKRKSFESSQDVKMEDPPVPGVMDWALDMVRVREAWEHTKGAGVKICIIDDGLDHDHQAFAGKIVKSVDLLDSDAGYATHKHGSERHGTACASIACSKDPLALGIAPEAELMIVRTKGLGSVLEAEAIRWAADEGADVISCSWGPSDGLIDDTSDDDMVYPIPQHTRMALEYAATKGRDDKGCLIFFAAGNGKERVINDWYASHPNVLAIGSVNKEKRSTAYSDVGHPLFCCFPSSELVKDEVTGRYIRSYGLLAADRLGTEGYSDTDYFAGFGGTSASCPGMAGAAALMYSIYGDITATEAKRLLMEACVHPDREGIYLSKELGYGIIDIKKLIDKTLQTKQLRSNTMNTSTNQQSEEKNAGAPNSYALHIALNYVSVEAYGSELRLSGCENDAKYYHALCDDFTQSEIIKNKKATRSNICNKIKELASKAKKGDYVFITYAGHGSQVKDRSGDEKDKLDETLVLYDQLLIDDEINELLSRFKSGVNVIWIADSCHSGTNTRNINVKAIPPNSRTVLSSSLDANLKKYKDDYAEIWDNISPAFRSKEDGEVLLDANVIAIAAVQDEQYAGDLPENGLFTGTLRSILEQDGKLSYKALIEKAISKLKSNSSTAEQIPKLTNRSNSKYPLEDEIFFSVKHKNDGGGQSPIKEKEKKQSEETPPQYVYHESRLVIDSDIRLTKLKTSTARRGSTKRSNPNFKRYVSYGTIKRMGSRSGYQSAWDEAYEVMLETGELNQINFVEPDIVSAINGDPEDIQQARSGEYLSTYPNPDARHNQEPLIWHLDEDHSQLRAAFEMIKEQMREEVEFDHSDVFRDEHSDQFPLIAHIDTGVLEDHPTTPINFLWEESQRFANPIDKDKIFGKFIGETQGHGQATMTILAGNKLSRSDSKSSFNGYLGAFPYAQVMSLRISETVVLLSGRKFADAVDYAIAMGADVITMSMAGAPSKRMLRAVNRAYEAGIVIVSAAGNSWTKGAKQVLPDTIMYPARFNRVIGVTGVTYDDTSYLVDVNDGWQNRNRAEGGKYMQTCHGPSSVMDNIMAAYTPNITWAGREADDGIFVKSGGGTSSATPQVAAAAAMYLHYYRDTLDLLPGWQRVEAVRQALFQSASTQSGAMVVGKGILRAKAALEIEPTQEYLDALQPTPPDELRKGWLKNIFDMFTNRGIPRNPQADALQEKLIEMMSMEIEQLIMTEPDLYEFQSDGADSTALKIALLEHPNASDYLKRMISKDADIVSRSRLEQIGTNSSRGIELKKDGELDNRMLFVECKGASPKIELDVVHDADESLVRSFSIDIESVRSQSFELALKCPEEDDLAYLITTIDERGHESYEWHYPNLGKEGRGHRSIFRSTESYTITIRADRNIIKKIVKVVVRVVKIALDLCPARHQGLVYLQDDQALGRSLKDDALPVDGDVVNVVNAQDQIILFLHGLFSSTEEAFKEIYEDPHFKDHLGNDIVLGYNMSTVRTSILDNATALLQDLVAQGIDLNKVKVIAHSRGALVARCALANRDTKIFMASAPHLGTPLVDDEYLVDLVQTYTKMFQVVGTPLRYLANVGYVLRLIKARKWIKGITDMGFNSDFIDWINDAANDTVLKEQHTVVGANYVHEGFGASVDALIDRVIFDDEPNDMAVPWESALSIGVGAPKRILSLVDASCFHTNIFKHPVVKRELRSFL